MNNGLEEIGTYAFYQCRSLRSVHFPDSLKTIGIGAFQECGHLTEVAIPKKITRLEDYAFSKCSSLKEIVLPDGLEEIGTTFSECTGLETINLSDSIEEIAMLAFSGCTKLKTVNYGGSREQWEKIAIKSGNQALENAEIGYNSDTPDTPDNPDNPNNPNNPDTPDSPETLIEVKDGDAKLEIIVPSLFYNKKIQKSKPYVFYDSERLTEGVDYTVEYPYRDSNNQSGDHRSVGEGYIVNYKNNSTAGMATATVKGTGNFTGSVVVSFYD